MIIKKFANGKIKLELEKADYQSYGGLVENIYHQHMSISDLYINQINGYQYVVDFSTNHVYELGSYLLQNPLKYIVDELEENKKMYLYPLSKSKSKDLLQCLENGY